MTNYVSEQELEELQHNYRVAYRKFLQFKTPWRAYKLFVAERLWEAARNLKTYKPLQLCAKHQQEPNRSQFSEHNCDYCNLLKEKKHD